MRLEDIPSAARPTDRSGASAVVARIRALRPSRRVVLRGLVLGAAAAALVPLDWYLSRRSAAAAPAEEGDRSEFTTCVPENYDEERNNWPAAGRAVCYGGWRRGGFPCSGGWHREGRYADAEDTADSTRVTTSCHGRNAWRWLGHRCSDAVTTVTFADGTEYTGLTIAACVLDESDVDGAGENGAGADGAGEDGAGDADRRPDGRDRERDGAGLGSLF